MSHSFIYVFFSRFFFFFPVLRWLVLFLCFLTYFVRGLTQIHLLHVLNKQKKKKKKKRNNNTEKNLAQNRRKLNIFAAAFLWLRINAIRAAGGGDWVRPKAVARPTYTEQRLLLPPPPLPASRLSPLFITWLGLPTRITNALTVRLSLTKLNVFIN